MTKTRLEAFSDGVVAILITIMVLELKVPEGHTLEALKAHGFIAPFSSYVLSFVFLGIYWNNHHHMLHITERVSGGVLWANMHLLFWLSLVPFTTHWMGAQGLQPIPVAVYGVVLLCSAISYTILQILIIRQGGKHSKLLAAVGGDFKGKLSMACYAVAIGLAFVNTWISIALYVFVALLWLVPDKRIERHLAQNKD